MPGVYFVRFRWLGIPCSCTRKSSAAGSPVFKSSSRQAAEILRVQAGGFPPKEPCDCVLLFPVSIQFFFILCMTFRCEIFIYVLPWILSMFSALKIGKFQPPEWSKIWQLYPMKQRRISPGIFRTGPRSRISTPRKNYSWFFWFYWSIFQTFSPLGTETSRLGTDRRLLAYFHLYVFILCTTSVETYTIGQSTKNCPRKW